MTRRRFDWSVHSATARVVAGHPAECAYPFTEKAIKNASAEFDAPVASAS